MESSPPVLRQIFSKHAGIHDLYSTTGGLFVQIYFHSEYSCNVSIKTNVPTEN